MALAGPGNPGNVGSEQIGASERLFWAVRFAAGVAPIAELPPPNTKRWVVRRKAAVVGAVRNGKITLEEACRRYQLSEEEFLSWQRAFETHGLHGLLATRGQRRRKAIFC
jgi:uncharacterized protein DUF1153